MARSCFPLMTILVSAAALGMAQDIPTAQAQPTADQLLKSARDSYAKGDFPATRKTLDQAEPLIPEDDARRYDFLKQRADLFAATGQFDAAQKDLDLAIQKAEAASGANYPKHANDLTDLAMLSRRLGDSEAGLKILERVLAIHLKAGGADSSEVADDFSRMALLYVDEKQPANAAELLVSTLKIREKLMGVDHPGLLAEIDRLAAVEISLQRYDAAELTYHRALAIRERVFGPNDSDLISSLDGLAYAYFGEKKYDDAEAIYNRLLNLWKLSAGPNHPMVALTLDKIALFYREQKRWEEATAATDKANSIRQIFLAEGLSHEAAVRMSRGDSKEAERLLRQALAGLDPDRPEQDSLRDELSRNLRSVENSGRRVPAGKTGKQ